MTLKDLIEKYEKEIDNVNKRITTLIMRSTRTNNTKKQADSDAKLSIVRDKRIIYQQFIAELKELDKNAYRKKTKHKRQYC